MKSIELLTLISLILPNHNPEIIAQKPEQVISQNMTSLCRRVYDRNGLVVHVRPTPNSPEIGRVEYNSQVTLTPNYQGIRGPEGGTWLEIAFPIKGFISNGLPNNPSNLVLCPNFGQSLPSENPRPNQRPNQRPNPINPNNSLCRQVNRRGAPKGLAVRADASRSSAYRGKIPAGGRVILVDDYRLVPDKNREARQWLEITSPVWGFVSASNLVRCR